MWTCVVASNSSNMQYAMWNVDFGLSYVPYAIRNMQSARSNVLQFATYICRRVTADSQVQSFHLFWIKALPPCFTSTQRGNQEIGNTEDANADKLIFY